MTPNSLLCLTAGVASDVTKIQLVITISSLLMEGVCICSLDLDGTLLTKPVHKYLTSAGRPGISSLGKIILLLKVLQLL